MGPIGRKELAVLLFLLALSHVPDEAVAETLHVPEDYATINSALWAAHAGDTVLLACGTYNEVGLYLYQKSDIVLRSAGGNPECATIDGQLAGDGILNCIGLTGDSRIEGITFANGGGENWTDPDGHGGVHIEDSSVVFDDCAFLGNQAGRGGGALYCVNSNVDLRQCDFVSNQADWNHEAHADGGAVFAYDCTLTMEQCRFESNVSTQGAGMAVYLSQTSMTAGSCDFIENGNLPGEGGAALRLSAGSLVSLVAPRFEDNWAVAGLGSVEVGANCVLAVDGGFFVENHCGLAGGADEIGVASSGSARISGTTFIAHLSADHNPLFYVDGPGGELVLDDCLVVLGVHDEISDCGWGEVVDFTCSDVWSASGDAWVDCYADQLGVNGNISADPQFCGIPGSGDYTLQSDSPCAPANNSCGELIGALPVGCEGVAAQETSISAIKALY